MEENLVWKLISYFFLFYESYEIKFPTKISSFTVLLGVSGVTESSENKIWELGCALGDLASTVIAEIPDS